MKPTARIFRLILALAWTFFVATVFQASAASAATFTVNTTADTVTAGACAAATAGQCSLREAVIESNANTGPNTINVPAGVYQLTRAGTTADTQHTGPFDSQNGELDVQSNTTISGAGQGTDPTKDTIVEAGTDATNGINLIFIVNGYQAIAQAKTLNVTLQHMTMRFGFNRETDINGWGDGGAVEFDSTDGGTLTLNDDLITQNSDTNDPGGGVAVFNTARSTTTQGQSIYTSTASRTTIENSSITNNNAVQQNGGGGGGGVFDGSPEPITIQNSTITGNTATAAGGGVEAPGQPLSDSLAGVPINSIQNTTISNNQATNEGGGLLSFVPFSISGSTFSGNSTTSGGLNQGGGGILTTNEGTIPTTITTSTITGNTVTGSETGGGVLNISGTLNLTFSRITGNHAPAASSGIGLNQSQNNVAGNVNATNDWWGCDSGPLKIGSAFPTGCDSATNENTFAGSSFSASPWITLKTTASPTSIQYGATSALSASFLQNSSGTALTAAQIPPMIGLPVTWAGVHGSISNAQSQIQSAGTATATFTAGSTSADCGTGSGQSQVDGVPPGEVPATASITVLCPDFSVSSTNDVSGQTQLANSGACPPQCWTWTDTVSNSGPGFGTFSDGQTILADNLPNSNVTYGAAAETNISGVTGTIACSVNSTDDLVCKASGPVQINSNGSFKVTVQATPSATGTFANPRSPGACSVDPANDVPETSDANNSCSNTVTVTAPDLTVANSNNVSGATTLANGWTWKAHVANTSTSATGTFLNGDTILTDQLDNSGHLTYGTPTVGNLTSVTGGANISCSISSNTLTCSATGTVVIGASGSFDITFTATPSVTGTYANPRSGGTCAVDPANKVPETNEANNDCNSDSVTVTAPDLTAALSDDKGGATTLGNSWTWKLHVANSGNGQATFASGQTLVSDDLPTNGVSYGTPAVANASGLTGAGSVSCSITSGALSCVASGGPVTIPAGQSFDITVLATPSATGTLTNPAAPGTCSVDPGNLILESNESNNTCGPDSVVVTAPDLTSSLSDDTGGATTLGNGWTWKIHVANGGDGQATFASGQTLVSDDLPTNGVSYGTPAVANASGLTGAGSVSCSIASGTLSCVASGGSVTIPAGQSFDVTVLTTPSATGTFTNPRSGGTCSADPGTVIVESDETNNACGPDSVTVTAPDLTSSLSDDIGGTTTLGSSWTWTVHVGNGGNAPATFASGQALVADDLPISGMSYGTPTVANSSGLTGAGSVSCTITSGTLSCVASGGSVTIPAGQSFDVKVLATPSATGTFTNPAAGGACSVDPGTVIVESDETNNACGPDSVTVTAPDLSSSLSDDTGGATTLGNGWSWRVHVANSGNGPATFTSGQSIVSDDLPATGVSYGSPTVTNALGLTGAGTVTCAITSSTLTCTASGGPVTIPNGTSFDVSVQVTPSGAGTFTNPRSGGACSVDPANVIRESDETNNSCGTDAVTVSAPDLTANVSDDAGGATTLGHPWNWDLHVANGGSFGATFAAGDTIVSDDLPSSGLTYGTPSVTNTSGLTGAGTVACAIASNTLTCTASGGPVTIPNGTSFDVSVQATPSTGGTFNNPRTGGSCSADPDNVVPESDETNNSCASDSVVVSAPDLTATASNDVGGLIPLGKSWNWTLHVANVGTSPATFTSGQRILTDDLPSAGLTYGPPTVANASGLTGSGTPSCSIASATLSCVASGGSVTIPAGQSLDVITEATPASAGTFANPRSGGSCIVDPDGVLTESDTTNNACSDSVTVAGPPSAQITSPPDGQSYTVGQSVPTSFGCSEGIDGPGISSCVDSNAHSSPSGHLDTSRPGTFTYAVTATSRDGLSSTATIHYSVTAAPTNPGGNGSGQNGPGTPGQNNGPPKHKGGRPNSPAGKFHVRHVVAHRNGTVQFEVIVPGPGTVNVLETAWKSDELSGAGIAAVGLLQPAPHRFVFARAHRTATHAEVLRMKVRPDRRGLRLIKHHRRPVRIRLWVTYTPPSGHQHKIGIYGIFVTP